MYSPIQKANRTHIYLNPKRPSHGTFYLNFQKIQQRKKVSAHKEKDDGNLLRTPH